MDVSHIRTVLQSLKKNHITVPIITNQYEETCALNIYEPILQDKFGSFDDFALECASVTTQTPILPDVIEPSTAPIRSLLDCLQSVKQPEKYKKSTKVELMEMLLDFKEFIANTLLKDLDIAKFKVTKKKLKEDLDTVYRNVDNVTVIEGFADLVRNVLIVASRKLECSVGVQGQMIMTIPCKVPITNVLNMNYENNCFTVL